MRFLIIEDDRINMQYLEYILEPYGEVHTADSGPKALEIIKTFYDNRKRIDLICLDIMIPEMNGIEILVRIRNLEAEYGLSNENRSKIFMITALSDGKTIDESYENECDAFIMKPILKEKIETLLDYFHLNSVAIK